MARDAIRDRCRRDAAGQMAEEVRVEEATPDELIEAMTDGVVENGVRYRVWIPWWVWAVVLTWGSLTFPLPARLHERAFRPVSEWGAGRVRMEPVEEP